MRVFVTGASGWIGSALVPELIGAGHQVIGLARSDAAADALAAAGAEVRRGALDDLDVLRDASAAADGVIHLAFKHDLAFSGGFEAAATADRRAVEVMGEALAGSGRPFVLASGLLALLPGRLSTERDHPPADPAPAGPAVRWETARLTVALAERGVRSIVLRLPPTVHGEGDHGFMASLVGIARDKGVAGYVGDGSNRWPAAHRLDVATLFLMALERAPAGSVLHAAAEEGVPFRAIAEVFGRHLGLPVTSIPEGEAGAHFGWLAAFAGTDSPASSKLTRELLGWRPVRQGLLDDLDQGHYFR
ncbi:SDR family oxidoreductase [Nonomuraea wenchangensis]|uniref:SDR family oxidoreductase n=1 Tax=Nonomuraea wenchangensis TaxID=568860 RepID=UPI0034381042